MYPSFIFDVHISFFLNKAFHCVVMAFDGCNMQGSLLSGESNKKCCNDSRSRLTDLVVQQTSMVCMYQFWMVFWLIYGISFSSDPAI